MGGKRPNGDTGKDGDIWLFAKDGDRSNDLRTPRFTWMRIPVGFVYGILVATQPFTWMVMPAG
jgi:hypothetical protein